jgi:hypothetical protein
VTTFSTSLLRSTLDLRLSEVSYTADGIVVRSAPGLVRQALAFVLTMPFVAFAFGALRHPDAVMLGLALSCGALSLPFVLLLGASVHEKSFSRRDGLHNRLRVLGWSTEESSAVPAGGTLVVRETLREGRKRFALSIERCEGMDLSVWNDEAAAVELARKLAQLLGLTLAAVRRGGLRSR